MLAKRKTTKKRPRQPGKAHDDELKAQVRAALLLGAGVMEVANELGLAHSTVSTYKSEIPDNKLDELRRKKGERLDEMVYDVMLATLTSLKRQADEVSTARFIHQQGAVGMATLYGVMADKSLRLLELTTRLREPAESKRQLLEPESPGA